MSAALPAHTSIKPYFTPWQIIFNLYRLGCNPYVYLSAPLKKRYRSVQPCHLSRLHTTWIFNARRVVRKQPTSVLKLSSENLAPTNPTLNIDHQTASKTSPLLIEGKTNFIICAIDVSLESSGRLSTDAIETLRSVGRSA